MLTNSHALNDPIRAEQPDNVSHASTHNCFVAAIIRHDWHQAGYSEAQLQTIEKANNGRLPQYHPDLVTIPPANTSMPEDGDPPPVPETSQLQAVAHSETPKWSILSDVISYHSCPSQELEITPIDMCQSTDSLAGTSDDIPIPSPHTLVDPFYTPYDGVICQLNAPNAYSDLTDVGTTYMGKHHYSHTSPFQKEVSLPIDHRCVTEGILPTGKKFKILFDTGATRSYLSYDYYKKNEYLHSLVKYEPRAPQVFVGSGDSIQALFVIPLQFFIDDHSFEVYTLVCKVPISDFIWGIKNIVETEGTICTRSMTYKFLNRSPRLTLTHDVTVPPDKQKYPFKLAVNFPKEVSGMAIIKFVTHLNRMPQTLKVPVERNVIKLQISNHSKEPLIYYKNAPIGILDARSLGYFHIGYEQMKNNILTDYEFQTLDSLTYQFNRMIDYVNDSTRDQRTSTMSDPYPWLDPNDPRHHQTDEEILDNTINLSNSCLTSTEKMRLMTVIKQYKKAFSLRDEIGECPNIRLNIDVIDDSPFFVRPFPISEKDKPIMDRQMNRLVSLGILSAHNTSHTSPVMLIARKVTQDKRPVVDFRLLNTRIRRRNTASPLLKDIFNILGHSRCEVMSCVDIKDAFHSIRLNEKSKEFCGILPYFGSTHYRYEVLPMGLAISPAAWLMYVNMLLDTFGKDKKSFIAIMDDLLIHSSIKDHFRLIEKLLKGLCEHGLKLSPKKSQLFHTELTYMGNIFAIKRRRMTIRPICTRLEAIAKYPRPRTVKQCKSFCGVVNYLSLFCKDLQKLLSPIYHLTKKGVPFFWTQLQETSFQQIKKLLVASPVLALPTSLGRFIIYSDTSRTHTGSALWQIQDGFPRLLGYSSKTLPSACLNYSVTELEMTGLLMNIHSWRGWTQDADIDVAVDHKAVVQIMKSKHPPTTDRVKLLIRKLSPLPFTLYYVRGKDLILADFLSRIPSDDSDPNEVLPISFVDLHLKDDPNEYLGVVTRSKTKQEGVTLPNIHGSHKAMDPHKKPEQQPQIARPLPPIRTVPGVVQFTPAPPPKPRSNTVKTTQPKPAAPPPQPPAPVAPVPRTPTF